VLVFAGAAASSRNSEALKLAGVEIVRDEANGRDLSLVLGELGQRLLQSVLVEGGANVAGRFLDEGLVDKVSFFIAPLLIGGRDAPNALAGSGAELLSDAWALQDVEITARGKDIEVTGYPVRRMRHEG
jgi:diaminohydroxyphosphoribosylaminopyrimidine deaminase/5-amino-6-(5-phosphoribosylamino)uracil reductase